MLASAFLVFFGAGLCYGFPTDADLPQDSKPDPEQKFRQALEKISSYAADPCSPPDVANQDPAWDEYTVFNWAAAFVTQELNAPSAEPVSPKERATKALDKLERISAEINKAWPDENRFHSQVLDIPPALVVKMTIRMQATFSVLGIPDESSRKPNREWHEVGSGGELLDNKSPGLQLDLYPLHRGPSGHARFLARFEEIGCAGNSIGVVYDGSEWDQKDLAGFDQIINQEGNFGLGDPPEGKKPTAKDPFTPIGMLRTDGRLITLPYCWFSAIDTWDNPSICALDTYDLSGDNVKFRSRSYNRPDLLPIAKAIEYAEKRDYPAVLGYCASGDVARRMVRDLPPDVFAGDLRVTHTAEGKERVELGYPASYRFDVEKRNGRWLVTAFAEE